MRCSERDEFVVEEQQVIPYGLGAVALVEPFVMPAGHHFSLVEVTVDDLYVVSYAHIPLRPCYVVFENGYVAWKSVLEETLLVKTFCYEEVIVEIDEVLRQIRYAIHIAFYHHGVVCGQEFFRDEVLVTHKVYLRIVLIQPFRLLAACDKMYFPDPGGEFLDTAEPVFQKAVVSEACL